MKKSQEFFRLTSATEGPEDLDSVEIEAQLMPIHYRRHGRARNYVLRLHTNCSVMVTIPRHGTKKFAREFVASRRSWLEKQWRLLKTRNVPPQVLLPGMEILVHGQSVLLEVGRDQGRWELRFGTERTTAAQSGWQFATGAGTPFAKSGAEMPASTRSGIGCETRSESPQNCCPQPAEPVGILFIQRHDFSELATDPIACLGAGLHHCPRIDALAGIEPFTPVLSGGREGLRPDYRSSEDWLKQNSGRVGF